MRRHEFEPGKLVVGLVLLACGGAYLAAAHGSWHFPAFVLLPVLGAGFCVAGLVSSLALVVRRHRARGGDRTPADGPRP
ncbi:hypothetical protein ABZ951_29155 [Streptomyces sp. NPDC046215]|uniref:Integral membrane protein n=1 Tax=Streptomyces stramineus TaxID=173861 RepID=A0ABN1AUS6_9ACTN